MEKLIFPDKDARLERALKESGKTEEQLNEDVDSLKEWINTQKHLPEMPSDNMIMNFLFLNKFSMETSKKKLDMYYTIRSLLPEVYANKHPRLPHMQQVIKDIYIITLPKVTVEGYVVSVLKVRSLDVDVTQFDPYDVFAQVYNVGEVRMHEDIALGDVYIYDMSNMPFKQVVKLTPVVVKKITLPLEKVYSSRVKGMHFLNVPSYAETIIKLAKQLMNPKLAERIHVHDSIESLKKAVSSSVLPKDYGGDQPSLDEINGMWMKLFEQYYDRFDTLDKLKVNEELRPTPLVNDDILGIHGHFRKLNVD